MIRSPITAVIIALNEEHDLPYALRSVRPFCDEVILVDMMSDDRTIEVARPLVDLVLSHPRIEAFDAARQLAVENARHEWILSIDADEIVPPKLGRWIADFVAQDPPWDVVYLPRVNVFLGRWLRSSNFWPGHPRLWRKGTLRISHMLHRGLVPNEDARIKKLPKDPTLSMWHFSYLSLHDLVDKSNLYTSIEARQALAAGKPVPRARSLFSNAVKTFWNEYVKRRGYQDGMNGLTYAINRAMYRYLSMAKRWDETRIRERGPRYDEWRERMLAGYEEAPTS